VKKLKRLFQACPETARKFADLLSNAYRDMFMDIGINIEFEEGMNPVRL
jgi:hypothetical protein